MLIRIALALTATIALAGAQTLEPGEAQTGSLSPDDARSGRDAPMDVWSLTVPADHAFERFLDPVLEVHQYVVFIRKHDRSLIWGNVNVNEVFRHFEIQRAGWIVCVCRCRVVGAKRFIQSFRDFWIIHRTSVDVKELPICRSPRRSFLILETG